MSKSIAGAIMRGARVEIGGDEHVVGYACCHLGDCGCRGGCDHEGIRPEAEIHMAVPLTGVGGEELADYGPSA